MNDRTRRGDHDPLALSPEITGDAARLLSALSQVVAGSGSVYSASVVRTGDKVIVPEGANLPDVISALRRQHESEQQIVRVHVTMPVAPWDGAMALKKAIEKNLGVFNQMNCACGNPDCGVHQMDVEIGIGESIRVPWGTFELPGMEGAEVTTRMSEEEGRNVFACEVKCKRRYEDRVRRLLDTVREIASKESLHRGKAFSISFHDEDGDLLDMPKPKFFEFSKDVPIFNAALTKAIERNIMVPIKHPQSIIEMGESLKRSAAFVGHYGGGKTLLASHIARVATENGWTFMYVKDAKELPMALQYAQQYQPVVVFAEDVDRIAGLERTDDVNDLLNQLDGIDSKSSQIMTIVTSNHPERINPAMRRPGRIDLFLEVLPPDSDTVGRMIRHYAGAMLDAQADLTEVAAKLAGESPARIRESIGRAKLAALGRTGRPNTLITAADLMVVADEVKGEAGMFAPAEKPVDSTSVTALADGFAHAASALRKTAMNGAGHGQPASH